MLNTYVDAYVFKTYEDLLSHAIKQPFLLDPAISNSVISNFPLFRTKNHFPWICPSVIYYQFSGGSRGGAQGAAPPSYFELKKK